MVHTLLAVLSYALDETSFYTLTELADKLTNVLDFVRQLLLELSSVILIFFIFLGEREHEVRPAPALPSLQLQINCLVLRHLEDKGLLFMHLCILRSISIKRSVQRCRKCLEMQRASL